mgnify:FL=1
MKPARLLLISTLLLTLFSVGCGSDSSSEAESLMKKQAVVTESFVEAMTGAGSADAVAGAIETYTRDMKELIPDIRAFQEKYPDYSDDNMPEKAREYARRLQDASAKVPAAMMKTGQYMSDPKVREAMTRLTQDFSNLK